MYDSALDEKTAPLVWKRSFAVFGSDMIMYSLFPSQIGYRGPYFFAHLSRLSSGSFDINGSEPTKHEY
jgi:hypothetical protein